MRRTWWVNSFWCALIVGCGDAMNPGITIPGTSTGGGGEATQGVSETGVPTSGGSTGAPASTGGETSGAAQSTGGTTTTQVQSSGDPFGLTTTTGTTCDFICPVEEEGCAQQCSECDVFAQDCPVGEKCSAYANDGGNSWNAAKCVPVMEDPQQPGDACMVEGNGVSGVDNCDLGSYCWDVDAENIGVCVALCKGNPDAAFCEDSGKVCAIVNQGVLNLCLDSCDPLAQDCDPSDVCIANSSGDEFLCVLDASGDEGQQHDPCEFANSCDAGLLCLNSTAASECDPAAAGCCEPFCDLGDPDADVKCGGVGQVCNAYFEEGTAPPGFENVGVCAIPM